MSAKRNRKKSGKLKQGETEGKSNDDKEEKEEGPRV